MTEKQLKEKMKGKEIHQGCLCCGGTEEILSLDTKLYDGFGGWTVTKNGETIDLPKTHPDKYKWEELTSLNYVEKMAQKEPESEWLAVLFLPLRGATYQRSDCGKWVLIDSNEGFA